jgi:ERF superfamily
MSEATDTAVPAEVGEGNHLGALAAKLVTVMATVATVPKRGHNTFHNYDYATEGDVADAVRHAMVDARVVMIPSLVEIREREVQTRQQRSEIVTTVIMEYLVLDADTGASLTFRMPGSGQDPGDKGLMKAVTAATKYAQLKAFQLSTGDDPEADEDERVEREPGADEDVPWAEGADDELPPDASSTPTAPAATDCITAGKAKRIYALMGEAAKRMRTTPAAIKERTLEKIRTELHVQQIEHIPWKGNAYTRVCEWIEAQGRK